MPVNTSSMGAVLKSKVGGVPVLMIGAVGIGVGVWYLKKNAASSAATDTSSTNPNSAITGMDYSNNPLPTISTTIINTGSPSTPTPGGTLPPISGLPIPAPPKPPNPLIPPKPVVPTPKPPPKKTSKTYTVKKGDNLTNIAKALHVSLASLESLNKSTITADAKSHGDLGKGSVFNWIFPGEKLVVPA